MEREREREREKRARERNKREGNTSRTKNGKAWRARVNLENGVSVYVSNIPAVLDKFGLQGIFNRAGKVLDSFIPKRRLNGTRVRYGFVRYATWNEARKSIQLLHNKSIRGYRIAVNMARINKGTDGTRKPHERHVEKRIPNTSRIKKKEWRPVKKKEWRPVKKQHGNETLPSIQGQVNEDFLPWLSKSLICTSQEPRDITTLSSAIFNGYGQVSRVYALSGYKFILTYPTEEARDEALRNH